MPRPNQSSRPQSSSSGGSLGKKVFFKRRKSCPLSGDKAPKIDYKDVRLLSRFTSERGKLLPSRITSVSASKQRKLAQAVKRARNLSLMPFVKQ